MVDKGDIGAALGGLLVGSAAVATGLGGALVVGASVVGAIGGHNIADSHYYIPLNQKNYYQKQ